MARIWVAASQRTKGRQYTSRQTRRPTRSAKNKTNSIHHVSVKTNDVSLSLTLLLSLILSLSLPRSLSLSHSLTVSLSHSLTHSLLLPLLHTLSLSLAICLSYLTLSYSLSLCASLSVSLSVNLWVSLCFSVASPVSFCAVLDHVHVGSSIAHECLHVQFSSVNAGRLGVNARCISCAI